MLVSNGPTVKILQDHEAVACTDVSGFGLLGHLLEMLGDDEVSLVEIDKENVIGCRWRWSWTSHPFRHSLEPKTVPRKDG